MKHNVDILDAYGNRIYVARVEDPSRGVSGSILEAFIAPYSKLPAMDFSDCQMYWAMLEGADLSFCNFSRADLSGANLKRSVLRYANLSGARLSGDAMGASASIEGADLTCANLEGADLTGVTYSGSTCFPENFDLEGRGLLLVL